MAFHTSGTIDNMSGQEKKRLTLRLDPRLIEQAKAYAAWHHISVSELVEAYFIHLSRQRESVHTPLVQELTGLLPPDEAVEQAHDAYLIQKYGGRQ